MGRRFLPDRRRKVHFFLIKWLRYRTWGKSARRATLQLGAVCVSIHSNRFSPSLAHFPPSLLSFPASLSVYTGCNGHLFPEIRSGTLRGRKRREKEKKREKKRKKGNHRAILPVPPSEIESRKYARFKTSDRALDPIKLSVTWYTIAKQRFLSSRLTYRPRLSLSLSFHFSPFFILTNQVVCTCVWTKLSAGLMGSLYGVLNVQRI